MSTRKRLYAYQPNSLEVRQNKFFFHIFFLFQARSLCDSTLLMAWKEEEKEKRKKNLSLSFPLPPQN